MKRLDSKGLEYLGRGSENPGGQRHKEELTAIIIQWNAS